MKPSRLLVLTCTVAACAQPKVTTAPSPAAPAATKSDSSAAAGLGAISVPNADPFPSTYKPWPSKATVIRHATIMTAAGPAIRDGSILLRDGKIVAVGAAVDAPADAVVIEAQGKYVTPGFIDVHSHMGDYAAPGGDALSDGNEATEPSTPYVWAEHSVWPQDPQFRAAWRAGDDDPGAARSANLIGGRSVVLKVVPGAPCRR